MNEWYLYLIRCSDGSLYTGITTDIDRRFQEHQGKGEAGAKYLRGRGPLKLAFQIEVENRKLALKLESKIKRLSKARKEKIVSDNRYIEKIMAQIES